MPTLKSPDLEMHYEVDDFTDPWTKPDTILMLHGNSESGLAWYGWVPISRASTASCGPTCAATGNRRR